MKQQRIFELFLYHEKLRFSEIAQHAGLRSNEVAYYLKRLLAKGVLVKNGEHYALSASSQKQIPYYHRNGALSPLPVVLVRCLGEDGSVLLIRREKRPYDGLWSLPGGRLELGETVLAAAARILKQKTFLESRQLSVHAVCNERIVADKESQHGFVLLVVTVEATSTIKEKARVRWFTELPADTIPSDAFLVNADPGFYECVLTPRPGTSPVEYDAFFQPLELTREHE